MNRLSNFEMTAINIILVAAVLTALFGPSALLMIALAMTPVMLLIIIKLTTITKLPVEQAAPARKAPPMGAPAE